MFKLPPGPSGLPFLGYYPFLSSEPEKDYTRMGKIYGDIFSFRSLGGNLIVVVNSVKLIKEVLVKRADEFQGRPKSYSLDSWFTGGLGASCTPVVSRSFEHDTGDSTIWLGSTPILRENTLEVVRGLPPLFPCHQPHERTCSKLL
ncbi:cytochrome P450 2J5 [Trichonephila clavipes]|nr:cytochrome P450 2J5 [Trichonephila clavipes]